LKILEINGKNSDMPCFIGKDINIILRSFIGRFHLEKKDEEIKELMNNLVKDSTNNRRTYQYDIYQQITNGIKP
jgi:hypothetical protein